MSYTVFNAVNAADEELFGYYARDVFNTSEEEQQRVMNVLNVAGNMMRRAYFEDVFSVIKHENSSVSMRSVTNKEYDALPTGPDFARLDMNGVEKLSMKDVVEQDEFSHALSISMSGAFDDVNRNVASQILESIIDDGELLDSFVESDCDSQLSILFRFVDEGHVDPFTVLAAYISIIVIHDARKRGKDVSTGMAINLDIDEETGELIATFTYNSIHFVVNDLFEEIE